MGRTSLKDIRRKEIIQSFYKVSRKIGLEQASLAKVAEHMDINPSLVIHYFKTRDELIMGLIHFILEKYSDIYTLNGTSYSDPRDIRKLVDILFSRKWDKLFDDSVFYSCYAITYRDKKIRHAFKSLHDSLRKLLVEALQKAKQHGIIDVENEKATAEIIFALVEGTYYYLGMVDSKTEYTRKLNIMRKQALALLGLGD